MVTVAAATMSPSTSDPFLSTHIDGPAVRPRLKLRPASMVLPTVYTYNASLDSSEATGQSVKIAPPSPAPFVGTQGHSANWPASGPTLPPSPLMPPSHAYFGALMSPTGSRTPLSPLRQGNEDDYGFPAVSGATMIRSASDRLSPYSMGDRRASGDRKNSQQRSKLQQLFGKGQEQLSMREKSPAGFPFPVTPPLTPPYTAADQSAPRLSPLLTPLPAPNYIPPSPPASTSPISSTEAGAFGSVSSRALATHQLHERFAREYRILGELGSGGFGFVVRAIRLSDKRIVAVKFITISKVPSHAWVKIPNWDGGKHDGTSGSEALIPMEAFVLRRVRHEGVVSFLDLFEHGPYFYLVMEHHGSPWVAGEKEKNLTSPMALPALAAAEAEAMLKVSANVVGDDVMQIDSASPLSSSPTPLPRLADSSPPRSCAAPPMLRRASCDLFECIEQHKRLPEATARFVFLQVCEAVCHLLRLGICHRDIKDENIVIDKNYRVKLIDFGSAVIHDPRAPPPFYNRFWGTMNFASAEILASQPYRAPQAEVWALGVLLCLLVLGETPFSSVDRAREGRPSVNFSGISRDCHDLIMRCLTVDPDERITVDQILRHSWLCSAASMPLHSQSARMFRASTSI